VTCTTPNGFRIVNGFTRGYRPDADSLQTAVRRLSRFITEHHGVEPTACSWSAISRTYASQGV
jgi:hypothetical protein